MIWINLVRDYFEKIKSDVNALVLCGGKATALDVLSWIHENRKTQVEEYIRGQIGKELIKSDEYYKKVNVLPWGGVKKRYRDLMQIHTINPVLVRMFKLGELDREEIVGAVKWRYFKK